MITWGDMIDLIVYVFGITQVQLATLLGYNKSVISRIKNGEQSPNSTPEGLFHLIFDPTVPSSPARQYKNSDNSVFYLGLLKEAIETRFIEIRKAMDDVWNEKDYRQFVLILLERARPGVSETASKKMCKIFEQAVEDYNISFYVCKLPDYLMGEPFYADDSLAFVDTIRTNLLAKFISYQNEEVYKKIIQFQSAVETYSGCLSIIRLSVSEVYGFMLKMCGSDEIIELIDTECNEIRNSLDNKTLQENEGNDSPSFGLDEKLMQMEFIHSILLSYKQLCELYSEICPGKTLLV